MKTLTCTTKPPFPSYVDSSMLGAYKACPAKYMMNYFLGYQPTAKSVHLVAGGAYAEGLEIARLAIWHRGASLKEALYLARIAMIKFWGDFVPPEASPKTLPNMLLAIEEYFRHYGTLTDPVQPHILSSGKPAVEFSFALPLPEVVHPETGEPILYTGRFDMLGEFKDTLYAVDEKTAAQLGPSWLKQWDMRSQFSGYCWAAQEYGYPVGGAIVRGISILKKDFGHAQVITHRPKFFLERWLDTTVRTVQDMIKSYERDEWMQDFDGACTSYGGCPYAVLCDKKDPNRWVDQYFILNKWDPLATD